MKTLTKTDVQIVNYSEKAIIAIGQTKPIKEHLKAIGGRFSMWLKDSKGAPYGAAWIFSKKLAGEALELVVSGYPTEGIALYERNKSKLESEKAANKQAKTTAKKANPANHVNPNTKQSKTPKQLAKTTAITDISAEDFKAFQQFKQFLANQNNS